MPLIIKLCLVAIIWAIGIYFGLTASSDPAGRGYAISIPIISALIVSIPFAFSLSRTPVSENVRQHKALRMLLHVPLVLAVSPVVLIVVGYHIFFALNFIKFVIVLGLAGLAVWIFVVYRKRKRARCAATSQNPPADVEVTELPVRQPIPVEPVASLPEAPPVRDKKPVSRIWVWGPPLLAVPVGFLILIAWEKWKKPGHADLSGLFLGVLPMAFAVPASIIVAALRSRDKKPVCGIWAWVLPLLSVPIAFLLVFALGKLTHPTGFDGWGLLAVAILPMILAVPISFILAIVSLCRRERYPGLAVTLLVLYAVILAFTVFERVALLVVLMVLLIVGLVLLVAWLIRRRRRKRAASGIAPAHRKSRLVSCIAWFGKETQEVAGTIFHMMIALKRKITARGDLIGIAIGVAVTPVVIILAMVSMGAGHGDYLWAKVFFPVLTFVMVCGAGVFVFPFVFVQYPFFGWYIGRCISKRRFVRLAVILLILHVIPMFIMLTRGPI
jgi:Ca2+/Na+ antiporter